jgi:hypothetical protein
LKKMNAHLVLALAHLHLAADELVGHRVDIAVDVDVALEVDHPVVEHVDLGHPERQRPERGLLLGEELPGARVELPAESGVHPAAPGDGLPVGMSEVVELPSGKEVVLHVVEAAFDVGGAVGVPLLVRDEGEAVPLAEGGHLRDRHHLAPGAGEHHHVRVVDHARPAGTAQVLEGVGEPAEGPNALEAVDEDAPSALAAGDHHHRHLLAHLGQRGEEPRLAGTAPLAKPLVP